MCFKSLTVVSAAWNNYISINRNFDNLKLRTFLTLSIESNIKASNVSLISTVQIFSRVVCWKYLPIKSTKWQLLSLIVAFEFLKNSPKWFSSDLLVIIFSTISVFSGNRLIVWLSIDNTSMEIRSLLFANNFNFDG